MKFSIITINYNNIEGLKRTINSVISQTYKNFEYIVIDGGSTDGSKELIEKYQDHLAFWCSEPDKGVYNAMNKGIDHAKGEYINFMNSGDSFYDKNTLTDISKEDMVTDVLYGDWIRVYSDHEEFRKAPTKADLAFFYDRNICHQAMFIKREAHLNNKYDERFKIYADWALWQQLALKDYSFQYIPQTICKFEAITGISEKNRKACKIEIGIIKKSYPNSVISLIQENHNLNNELQNIGPRIRRLLTIRQNHPIYNIFLKFFLSPLFIIAKLLYKKEIESLNN